MKRTTLYVPSFLVGICIGAFVMYLLMKGVISQEFSGLEAAGNADYTQLRNEILDDFITIPILYLFPFTLLAGAGMAISGWQKNKKNEKAS